MACEVCTIHVCSGECWHILHGVYQGEYNLLPDQTSCQKADDEGEEDEDEDEDEDDGDGEERGAEIMRGFRKP